MSVVRQEFKTTDVVRLEVQDGWPDLPNLIGNPRGEGGAWGWSTPNSAATLVGLGDRLRATRPAGDTLGGSETIHFSAVAVTGDMQIRGAITRLASVNNGGTHPSLAVFFTNASQTFLGGVSVSLAANGTYSIPVTDVPATADQMRVFWAQNAVGGVGELEVTDLVLMLGTPAEIAASDPLTEPPWTNVLGSTHTINTERDELDAGFLNATIFDSTLDPASFDLIRPGKRCRLQAYVDGTWENLFTGLLDNPSTAYLVDDPSVPEGKRAQIQLVANDPAANLASQTRPNGVGTIDELPAILLGCGVPWNINGSTAAIDPDSTVVVAVNESASALDQVAITRDSAPGYAWVDRTGTLQAWDATELDTTVVDVLDETTYSDVDPDFDVQRLINDVVVNLSRINPGTGETEDIKFGPYTRPDSIREWRRRRAEFRIQGVDEADIPAFAAAVLDANGVPAKRINEVTLPLRTLAEVEAHALRDLYDLVELSNVRAGIASQQSRVTSVRHSLVASNTGGSWTMTLGFATEGTVAVPQVTPAPGATGKTLAQLLRPVGEVTMWFGAKPDIPAGWLPLDGSVFDGDAYPALEELLGTTTLPDLTDRFPIGAGTKTLGTTGGAPSVTLAANNLPPHVHGIARQTGPNTGGGTNVSFGNTTPGSVGGTQANTTTNDPIDILNPWLSLWFIIRAA